MMSHDNETIKGGKKEEKKKPFSVNFDKTVAEGIGTEIFVVFPLTVTCKSTLPRF